MNKTALISALALALLVSVPQAQAQKKMYRCGSIYQDRPCDAAPAAAKPAASAAAPPAGGSAAQQKAAYQKQLRCDNYSRQIDELRDKQKAMKQGDMLDAQVKSLEARMKGDSC